MTQLKEAIELVGGLSEADRMMPGIRELVEVGAKTSQAFREAVGSPGTKGHGGSIKKWFRDVQTVCQRGFREANSETALGFLVRKGVQTAANDWYQTAARAWQDYCRTASSTTVAEWYAPLYPSVIADRVDRGQEFPEGRVIGEDSHLVNQKFGLIEAFDRELFDDDQTGQIRQRAERLGGSMAITESVWSSSRFVGTSRTYANVTVPASGYSTTDINGTAVTTPFSATLYGSASGNRPSSYGILGMGSIKIGYIQLLNAVDPLQNKIITNPNCLLVSSQDKINADLLLAPGGYPAVIGQSAGTTDPGTLGGTGIATTATQGVLAGFPGGYGSPNPFAGMGIKVCLERYLADSVWAFGEAGKGLIFQERDPLEIVQEGPNTGASFSFDAIRFRSRRRFEVDWVGGGSRFWYLGSDGSAGSNQ